MNRCNMILLRRPISSLLAALLAVATFAACNSGSEKGVNSNYKQILDNDSIPQVIKNIVKAVHDNDPALFAKEVGYPLQRPYPLKDIHNEEEMKAYYNTMVDDSLKTEILTSLPDDWQKFGWRGYSLKDGSYLWIDESVYDIPYISSREQQLLDSLKLVESSSLPEGLRTGWEPILTLFSKETDKVYRIDKSTEAQPRQGIVYRLSIYSLPADSKILLDRPEQILDGDLEVEGSANVVSYTFRDRKSHDQEYVIFPDNPRTGSPSITLPDGTESDLEKAYWHELISR